MINEPHRQTILFDFDGTLIDQTHTIYKCHQYIQEKYGFPPLTHDEVKDSLGAHLLPTLQKHLNPEIAPEACLEFKKYYETLMHEEDFTYLPGSFWILENLKNAGYTIALFTNKPGPYARHILTKSEVDHLFHRVIGQGDTPYYKPQPEFTHHALSELKSCPNTAILIGDSTYDVDSAACVSLPIYIVTTGSHTQEDILNHHSKPNDIFPNLYELGHQLFGFTPPEVIEPPHQLSLYSMA